MGTIRCLKVIRTLGMPEVDLFASKVAILGIRRFLKGVFRLRPQAPRYKFTWDPSIVIKYLGNKYPNEKLTLLDLSRKLVTLLVLITGHRLQTIHLIKVENIVFSAEGAQILIPDEIKTSRPGNPQPCLHIPFYDKKEICVASALIEYIERTAAIRTEVLNSLFITTSKPHRAVSKESFARWVKHTLTAAGVDTSRFKPHSCRHASTSAAHRNGVPLDIIRSTAGWSQSSNTFHKFYNRPP
ncbi:hypothetical protein NQ317_006198 [Molorchus minor]|uniref:Tyr recombinase domain-containing protein n=1 Tax=Molorchus minor TaxID=1323400 RepID=A0ABQ9ITG0_9CUCU|nr:hypothetical protein NQ317_006198 [Molorchus minor]